FFSNDPARTALYTLSLHDALPIFSGPAWSSRADRGASNREASGMPRPLASFSRRTAVGLLWPRSMTEIIERLTPLRAARASRERDRKSTRLNSSHLGISYAVFCLK